MDPAQGEALCHFYVDLLYIQLLPCCYIESCQRYDTLVLDGMGRFWTEHMAPRPHHNSAGSRSQKYALNFGRSQIIYHPAHAHAMCFLCFLPYHTILPSATIFLNLIQIEQINHRGANAAWKFPFPHDRIEICGARDKYFSHGIRERNQIKFKTSPTEWVVLTY